MYKRQSSAVAAAAAPADDAADATATPPTAAAASTQRRGKAAASRAQQRSPRKPSWATERRSLGVDGAGGGGGTGSKKRDRPCATPGCTLRDFHLGPHSNDPSAAAGAPPQRRMKGRPKRYDDPNLETEWAGEAPAAAPPPPPPPTQPPAWAGDHPAWAAPPPAQPSATEDDHAGGAYVSPFDGSQQLHLSLIHI